MEEEEKKEEKEEVQPDPLADKIAEVTAAAARLEKANKRTEELLKHQAAVKAEAILSGTAEAGSQEQTQDEKEIAAARKMLEGTGFEDIDLSQK